MIKQFRGLLEDTETGIVIRANKIMLAGSSEKDMKIAAQERHNLDYAIRPVRNLRTKSNTIHKEIASEFEK